MKGLSLLELLLAMGITSILILIIGSAYAINLKIVSNQNASISVATQNQLGLDTIVNDIRESTGVSDTCCTVPGPEQSSNASKIVLKIWPLDIITGESVEPPNTTETLYDHIVYEQDIINKTLVKKIIPCSIGCTSKRVLSTKIMASHLSLTSPLAFTYSPGTPYSAATQVTVTLTTTKNNLGKDFTVAQSAKALIRNK